MSREHIDALWAIGADRVLWKWSPWPIASRDDMIQYVDKALKEFLDRTSFPFVTVEIETGRVIGSTRFMNINRQHRRVEIGCTWIGTSWHRTGLNREAKYLMLQAAFEDLQFDRVEFKTDMLNDQSKTAIRRLGGVEEGVLRHHVVTRSGRVRDTIYFSILRSEWAAVKRDLETQLGREG
ncbi:MAG: GNAT family N-acetyltransferase [Rhodothermales bacterium]|nr:GNAT family N-acetyltransferase [Rhodothermales bacterium]